MYSLGVDIGGTFTDLVLLEKQSGEISFAKTLTTYPDPTLGILNGIKEILEKYNKDIDLIETIVHGTTLVTNAVIERRGAKTALITTKGFEDVLAIGREMRYDIYDVFIKMPEPLIEKTNRIGVIERIDSNGKITTPINIIEVEKKITQLVKKGIKSIGVCLLNSYANNNHEEKIGTLLNKKFKGITYTLSSAVMPEIREYERASATAMNAYVQPLTNDYLLQLKNRLSKIGFNGVLLIMNSAGRLMSVDGARKFPIQLLESGPAGGTMASVFFGKLINKKDLLAFDMGGTTAKASMIKKLKPEITNNFEAAREKRFKKGSGLPVRIPVIDMIEIGAGGGSIAQINKLGLLEVGPKSASSTPGPACYDRGGLNPTVTDADLVLGFLDENYFLGGTMEIDLQKAKDALYNKIAKPLGISIEAAAWGIHRVVNENMANATRVHIIEKGLDPRMFSMIAFGGAGPVHAFNVAKLINAPELIIPCGAGVLSALGFLVSPIATEEIGSYVKNIDDIDLNKLNELINTLKHKAEKFVNESAKLNNNGKQQIKMEIVADMRYKGQGYEISIDIPKGIISDKSIKQISANFNATYLLKYGKILEGMPIESVTWRVVVSSIERLKKPKQKILNNGGAILKGNRNVYWGDKYESTPVYDRYNMPENKVFEGPCIIEEFESTTVVGKNSTVQIDTFKNIIIKINY